MKKYKPTWKDNVLNVLGYPSIEKLRDSRYITSTKVPGYCTCCKFVEPVMDREIENAECPICGHKSLTSLDLIEQYQLNTLTIDRWKKWEGWKIKAFFN